MSVFYVNDGYYVYFKIIKELEKDIKSVEYIGSDNKQCKLPIMGDIINADVKELGFPKSELFFKNINKINLNPGEYVLEMKCVKAGIGGIVRDFYEGISLYEKKKFIIKDTQKKKEGVF